MQSAAEKFGSVSSLSYELLEKVGDKLAVREGYKQTHGIDAVRLYLLKTHHWTPATVRAMSVEDLCLAVAEE